MIYGYIRVSSITQNIDRQLLELSKFNINKSNIYIDKESGKDFNRVNYQKLKNKIKKKDLLIIKSIDRLGRNYKMIINEWYELTKIKEVDIFVIDMPLLDTRTENNLIGSFISDIVLQILSFVAENERINIKSRQKEGIIAAKKRGVKFGRPSYKLPENFTYICEEFRYKHINITDAAKYTKCSESTFYKYYNKYLEQIKKSIK